jgi:class 3 adenylate cyclase
LTAEDLKDLGVNLVRHRRRFLDAIGALGTSTPGEEGTEDIAARSDAERRQLTVMFCDLVGSTALSSERESSVWTSLR